MCRVAVTEYVTIDGVMQDPGEWHFPYWSDEMGQYKLDEVMTTDALLLGRITYEGFAAAWPTMTDEQGFADRFNSIPKYVASTTLSNPEWNNSHVLGADLAAEVTRLKEQPGQDIVVHGSADLTKSLMELNLVDEVRLMVHPIVLGTGKRLFDERNFMSYLTLTKTEPLPNGVVVLTYAPAKDSEPSIVDA